MSRQGNGKGTMGFLFSRYFLVHLWTLSGLGFAMGGLFALFEGREDLAARLLMFPILIDFTDGTLARRARLEDRIPLVKGEAIDMITDVIALNFAPLVFFWKAGVFLPGVGAAICITAMLTCSLKYSMKENILQQGYSLGSSPIFFSIFLFYLLDLPPALATAYAVVLIALCLSPMRYPITSLVTTHWKFGWKSLVNYSVAILFVPIMIWMKDVWPPLLWALLGLVLVQLYLYPVLMKLGVVVRPGFNRYD